MDAELFMKLSHTRANYFEGDIHGEWRTQADGGIRWEAPVVVTGGLGRVPIEKPLPTCRLLWISAFQHLINATWSIHNHAKFQILDKHPMDPVDSFSFAVRCFLVWNSRCRKMINQYQGELRSGSRHTSAAMFYANSGNVNRITQPTGFHLHRVALPHRGSVPSGTRSLSATLVSQTGMALTDHVQGSASCCSAKQPCQAVPPRE